MKNSLLYVLLVFATLLTCMTSCSDYVNLGLPSGTQWKRTNEKGGFYTYDQAIQRFEKNLPTKEQWEELKDVCDWKKTDEGFKVIGPNNNYIILPASGYSDWNHVIHGVGVEGNYWSSTLDSDDYAWYIYFTEIVYFSYDSRSYGLSVRLVK